MNNYDELRKEIKATLAGDICSAQCLDEPADRRRVLDEVMRAIEVVGNRHAMLRNGLEATIN